MVETHTRRAYLTAIGTAGLVGLAGCSDRLSSQSQPDDGGKPASNGESISFPSLSAADPAYRNWQPGEGELEGVFQAAHNIERYRQQRDAVPAETYESGTQWAAFGGYVGIEFAELDGVLTGLSVPGVVSIGTFTRGDVESRLESMPYQQYTARNDVTYYRWEGAPFSRFVGVGTEGVVHGPGRQDASDPATRFVDEATVLFETARGDAPRLHETEDVYEEYTDAVGWPLYVWAGHPRPGGGRGSVGASSSPADPVPEDVATSFRWGFGQYAVDDSLVRRYWLIPTPDGAVGPEGIADAYRDQEVRSQLAGDGESIAVRQDGDIVEVGVLDPIEGAGGGVEPPLVALDVTREEQTATIRHVAGDPLPLSRVTVRVGNDRVDGLGDGTLSPGSSRTVDVPSGNETVRVIYAAPNAEGKMVLAES